MFKDVFFVRGQLIVAVLLSFSTIASAQYGTPESGLGRFLSENPDIKVVDEKHVDVPYERGKSVYRGRGEDALKLKFCVLDNKGEKVKVKGGSMKQFKNTSYSQLSNQLYNCDKPENKIIQELPRKAYLDVLYYFDVRYKLNLERK